ncbi:exodeoxyribonuclease VII large subunit [Marinimicrobium sp. ABcell2]|uniref:exodeoxyribonuclease VII large subunit n=1 Tax=Marinimicrobium sp. ABcell2 TaxID=3069751 RepID=UPI0027B61186|nr:exodeoxyribonuclease VII large subunit [Marinimicrobium sp. ABcell2]MDQ2077277.1 exodeoxyribonuclease VII large subunit [Marinimicrobium sp. ABcell2]
MTNPLISGGPERNVLSVSQLNRRSKQLLETHFPLVWVEGEVSNLSRPSSGHWYFTLKDDQAQVRCAMFRNRNQLVRFNPAQGQQLLLRARVSLYEGRGDYQLIAEHMEEAGFGALQRAFEELKQRLSQEGLFEQERKRPLPSLPKHIAVISSATGAAIRDILSVLERRFPSVPVALIPVPVQGKEAAPAIVRALELANRADMFDVVILTRGGGSLEDLWPFNEESVARAIYASGVPVVSAVGHEVDFSIADFVADVRAPTPSAAAELVVPDVLEYQARFSNCLGRLQQIVRRRIADDRAKLDHIRRRLRHPGERLQQQSQRLDGLEARLTRCVKVQLERKHQHLSNLIARQRALQPGARLQQLRRQLSQLETQLNRQIHLQLQQRQQRFKEAARLLNSVSPLKTLERGYAIATDTNGQVLHSSRQVQPGDTVRSRLAEGVVVSTVTGTED